MYTNFLNQRYDEALTQAKSDKQRRHLQAMYLKRKAWALGKGYYCKFHSSSTNINVIGHDLIFRAKCQVFKKDHCSSNEDSLSDTKFVCLSTAWTGKACFYF